MKIIKSIISLLFILLLLHQHTEARPVSYVGGWTAIQENNALSHSLNIHYTPSPKYSVGGRIDYLRNSSVKMETLQLNNLLKRWNNEDSQANIYLKSGIGIAHRGSNIRPAGFTGLAADWENRRFFASYANKIIYSPDLETLFNNSFRIGIAPYIAEYNSLHTWIMLQVDYSPTEDNPVVVTPMLRFFRGATMVELGVGIGSQLSVLGNITYRF